MFRLTKKTDYGLIALHDISSHVPSGTSGSVSTKAIAERYNIPVELLAKILQRLVKKGLLLSQNGPKGGYHLARGLGDITVGQVVEAIEGPIGIASCYHETEACLSFEHCTVRVPLRRVQEEIVRVLDRITLQDIAREGGQGVPVHLVVTPGGIK